jgi:hypothetical protein
VQRFPLDGSGPISTLAGRGRVATAGFVDDHTIVTGPSSSVPEGGERQTLWDLVSDEPVGEPSDLIDPVGLGVVSRWSQGDEAPSLSNVAGDRRWGFSGGVLDTTTELLVMKGSTSSRAFAVAADWIVAFDPETGRASRVPLDFTGKRLDNYWVMVRDVPGSDRAVVTWWDVDEAQMITASFDLSTGTELARGLYGDVASIPLPGGDVISTTSSELRRSSPDLDPVSSLPKPVAGANQFELSDDGATLLLQGVGQQASLYDLQSGTKLGRDIQTDSRSWESAHLSPDGMSLVTNDTEGVLLWDLDSERMASAACLMAGRAMTPTEWRTYFGEGDVVDTCATLRGTN